LTVESKRCRFAGGDHDALCATLMEVFHGRDYGGLIRKIAAEAGRKFFPVRFHKSGPSLKRQG